MTCKKIVVFGTVQREKYNVRFVGLKIEWGNCHLGITKYEVQYQQ